MSLQVGQPASRTYLRYGSCPGQRHRADRSGGVSCPLGYTAAEHSGNSDRSPLEGNPATQDGQTHSLQHRGCKMNIMKGKAHRIYELAYATMWCLCFLGFFFFSIIFNETNKRKIKEPEPGSFLSTPAVVTNHIKIEPQSSFSTNIYLPITQDPRPMYQE